MLGCCFVNEDVSVFVILTLFHKQQLDPKGKLWLYLGNTVFLFLCYERILEFKSVILLSDKPSHVPETLTIEMPDFKENSCL